MEEYTWYNFWKKQREEKIARHKFSTKTNNSIIDIVNITPEELKETITLEYWVEEGYNSSKVCVF